MENLKNPKAYSIEVATKIVAIGPMAISIANRWTLGWPIRVKALLKAGTYLECLESQVEQEKDLLAKEADLRHLARHEILQMYEIKESPPALE